MAIASPNMNFIDRRFILTAAAIGGGYSIIILLIAKFVSKDIAGVVGVALTALCTAIFKQFETLKFRELSDNEYTQINIEKTNYYALITMASVTLTTQIFISIFFAIYVINTLKPESFLFIDSGIFIISATAATATSYLLSGYIIGKAFRRTTYSTASIAMFISIILFFVAPAMAIGYIINGNIISAVSSAPIYAVAAWIAYITCGLIGVKLSNPQILTTVENGGITTRNSLSPEQSSQTSPQS